MYLWLVGVVSSSRLFAGGGVDELDGESGLDDETSAHAERPRVRPRGIKRVTLV